MLLFARGARSFVRCANKRPAPLWPEDKGDPAPVPLCPLDSLTPFPRRGCGPGPREIRGDSYQRTVGARHASPSCSSPQAQTGMNISHQKPSAQLEGRVFPIKESVGARHASPSCSSLQAQTAMNPSHQKRQRPTGGQVFPYQGICRGEACLALV